MQKSIFFSIGMICFFPVLGGRGGGGKGEGSWGLGFFVCLVFGGVGFFFKCIQMCYF